MTDIIEFFYDLFGHSPDGNYILEIFVAVLVLLLFSTIITFLFGIVAQFFRR